MTRGCDEAVPSRPALSPGLPSPRWASDLSGSRVPGPEGVRLPRLTEPGAARGAQLDPLLRCDLSL